MATRAPFDRVRDSVAGCYDPRSTWRAFAMQAMPVLARAVGAEVWCLASADPGSLLMTGVASDGSLGHDPRFFDLEYGTPDYLPQPDLVRGPMHAGALGQATGGCLSRSPRWRALLEPHGLGDQVRAALVSRGACWGYLSLMRNDARRWFDPVDVRMVAQLASTFAEGLRIASAARDESASDGVGAASGLILLDDDLTVRSATRPAECLLDWTCEPGVRPPVAVLAVAARAKAVASRDAEQTLPVARVRSGTRWVTLTGSLLEARGVGERIAVIVQPSGPEDVVELALRGSGLTVREHQIARLVITGRSNAEVAAELCIATLTVQQHLKSIFDKTGVRSRGGLQRLVFDTQFRARI